MFIYDGSRILQKEQQWGDVLIYNWFSGSISIIFPFFFFNELLIVWSLIVCAILCCLKQTMKWCCLSLNRPNTLKLRRFLQPQESYLSLLRGLLAVAFVNTFCCNWGSFVEISQLHLFLKTALASNQWHYLCVTIEMHCGRCSLWSIHALKLDKPILNLRILS